MYTTLALKVAALWPALPECTSHTTLVRKGCNLFCRSCLLQFQAAACGSRAARNTDNRYQRTDVLCQYKRGPSAISAECCDVACLAPVWPELSRAVFGSRCPLWRGSKVQTSISLPRYVSLVSEKLNRLMMWLSVMSRAKAAVQAKHTKLE